MEVICVSPLIHLWGSRTVNETIPLHMWVGHTVRDVRPSHFSILFLKSVSHLIHSTTSQLLELISVAIRATLCWYHSLSPQNLVNVGLPHHMSSAFGEFWQVAYQKLLTISGPKSFKASVPNWEQFSRKAPLFNNTKKWKPDLIAIYIAVVRLTCFHCVFQEVNFW